MKDWIAYRCGLHFPRLPLMTNSVESKCVKCVCVRVCPLPLHPTDFETQMERLALTCREPLIQDCEWVFNMHIVWAAGV